MFAIPSEVPTKTCVNLCPSVCVCLSDVTHRIEIAGLQDHLRAIFKNIEFLSFLVVLVRVFSEFWLRFWR